MGKLLKVGHIYGSDHRTRPIPVAATQYFHPYGGKFVYLDANGRVTFAITTTQYLYGWALTPRAFLAGSDDASNGYWTSSSTAGADKVICIIDYNAIFLMPNVSGVSMAQAREGEATDIEGTNDGTKQVADPGTSSHDVLLVRGWVDAAKGETGYTLVSLNPNEIQKDT